MGAAFPLYLLTSGSQSASGLDLVLVVGGQPGGAVVDVRFDGALMATAAVSGEGRIGLDVEVTAGAHLLEVIRVDGHPVRVEFSQRK